jgi:hypothetical protein
MRIVFTEEVVGTTNGGGGLGVGNGIVWAAWGGAIGVWEMEIMRRGRRKFCDLVWRKIKIDVVNSLLDVFIHGLICVKKDELWGARWDLVDVFFLPSMIFFFVYNLIVLLWLLLITHYSSFYQGCHDAKLTII